MLVLTTAAAEVVKSVTSTPDLPEGSGLRIVAESPNPDTAPELRLTTAAEPDAADQVLEGDGARLFVEPKAAAFLDDKIIDANVDEQGVPHLTLANQP
jgi:iron-sulfur cluster assembly protein